MLDVLLHVAGALAMMALAVLAAIFGVSPGWSTAVLWLGALLTIAFWLGREILQARHTFGHWVLPGSPLWSATKTREAGAPAIVAILVALAATAWLR